jgi:predicted protein tyrosine phosphatase
MIRIKHPPIIALGYSEAAMMLRNPGHPRIDALIAIKGQREFAVDTPPGARSLILDFDDCEAPSATDPIHASQIRLRQREAAEIGLRLCPPTIEHARQIIEFAQSIRDIDGALLCHCLGGVSRSPAAAILCLATWTGPGHESYCVDYVRSIRKCAQPHEDLVAFGDSQLRRKGELTDRVRDKERG